MSEAIADEKFIQTRGENEERGGDQKNVGDVDEIDRAPRVFARAGHERDRGFAGFDRAENERQHRPLIQI